MAHEDFVTYEQAIKLKELGFDRECNHYYYEQNKSFHIGFYQNFNDNRDGLEMVNGEIIRTASVSAPTLSQVQKWLREVKGIDVHYHYGRKKWTYYWGRRWSQALYEKEYDTPIEALSAGIDKAIEFLKEENNGK